MPHKTVSEVAALAGVSVRTLHHYDQIGLVTPTERTDAGYRLYDEDDLARLHDVLTWRALGFPLQEVRNVRRRNFGGGMRSLVFFFAHANSVLRFC